MNTKLDFEAIDMLSKGITQYAFRSGPVEEMHAKYKFTQRRVLFIKNVHIDWYEILINWFTIK